MPLEDDDRRSIVFVCYRVSDIEHEILARDHSDPISFMVKLGNFTLQLSCSSRKSPMDD